MGIKFTDTSAEVKKQVHLIHSIMWKIVESAMAKSKIALASSFAAFPVEVIVPQTMFLV